MRIESLRDLLSQFPDTDGFWNFDDLAQTENQIKDLVSAAEKVGGPKLIELLTQLARVQGLAGKLNEAGATLLQANNLLSQQTTEDVGRAKIRYLIEQGRFFGLSMKPSQAIAYFLKAWEDAEPLNQPALS